ncbi:hypothetical protein HY374_00085 [Candidatus Berkelbacteria bacterium]|nr:hypothetical protein [Candidatus Berkelbacteria bacterium]
MSGFIKILAVAVIICLLAGCGNKHEGQEQALSDDYIIPPASSIMGDKLYLDPSWKVHEVVFSGNSCIAVVHLKWEREESDSTYIADFYMLPHKIGIRHILEDDGNGTVKFWHLPE